MAENKHTPGPWALHSDEHGIDIRSANPEDLAEAPLYYVIAADIGGHVRGDQFDDFSEVEANARLIVTSPDLLNIAQRLVKWDRDYPVNCYDGYAGLKALNEIIADAKATIAKATQ